MITHTLVKSENLAFLLMEDVIKESTGKIDLIYIDPPYNTHQDVFTYSDDQNNTEWLSFMKDRLVASKGLLKRSGILAVSIDDSEVHHLRVLLDELYGTKNFIAQLVVDGGTPKNNTSFYSITHEYILIYAFDKNFLMKQKIRWRKKRDKVDLLLNEYEYLKKKYGTNYDAISKDIKKWLTANDVAKRLKAFNKADKKGLYTYADLSTPRSGRFYDVLHPITGKPCSNPSRGWGITEEKFKELIAEEMIIFGKDENYQPLKKFYLTSKEDQVEKGILSYPSRTSTHLLEKLIQKRNAFSHPKNLEMMKDLISYITPEKSIIFDFFAGSGTTGHAVIELNNERPTSERVFLLVTNNENNIFEDVTKPRIEKVIEAKQPHRKQSVVLLELPREK